MGLFYINKMIRPIKKGRGGKAFKCGLFNEVFWKSLYISILICYYFKFINCMQAKPP